MQNFFNTLALTTLSVLLVLIFINTGANKYLFFNRIATNWKFTQQLMYMDEEQRKVAAWGPSYYASKFISDHFKKESIDSPVVLFEPNSFYIEKGIEFRAPEPVTFYYFTGLNGIWKSSEDIMQATHCIKFNDNRVFIYTVTNQNEIEEFLNEYSDYKIAL